MRIWWACWDQAPVQGVFDCGFKVGPGSKALVYGAVDGAVGYKLYLVVGSLPWHFMPGLQGGPRLDLLEATMAGTCGGPCLIVST